MRDELLDNLLARPLSEPDDAGFSAQVAARLLAARAEAAQRQAIALLGAVAAVLALLLFTAPGAALLAMTPALVSSPVLMLAAAVLVLSGTAYRTLEF